VNSPALSPENSSGSPEKLIQSNYSLKLWLIIAWTGFLILPWYAAYDGFWSFIWLTEGYPTFDEYSPGILQITMHQRWWLWPVALALLIPLPALIWPRADPVIKAVDLINSDKKRFLHYLIDQPRFAAIADEWGGLTPNDFHLPRLRYTHPLPYTDEQVEDTYNWMVRWGLLNASVCANDFVDNRTAEPTAADD